MNQDSIIKHFLTSQNVSTTPLNTGFTGVTLGVVIDVDDPLQAGRVKVFCPTLNDDPKQLEYVPWSVYVSPVAGSINNSAYTRGVGDGKAESEGAIHYGFWGVPELGSHALVTCVDGDFRRRVWIGCVPEHEETNTMHVGRWKWENGKVDGPLTSSDKPIEPLYSNMKQAFQEKNDSPEWKTRVADYQISALRDDYGQLPNNKKQTYKDQTNASILENEPNEWTHETLGAHGYDWSSFKNLGAYLSSKAYGWSTPGMQSFVMDDRPFNNRIKLRTSTGHQILLDSTNERIYVATDKGNNWLEMDSNGNIDIFSATRVSISSTEDINLSAGRTIRMYAGESINMYAGHDNLTEDQPITVSDVPITGTITLQAETDFVMLSKNLRSYTEENTFIETGLNYFANVGDSATMTVTRDHNLSTLNGDHIVSSGNSIYSTSKSTTKHYSEADMSIGSYGDSEIQSFNGTSSMSGSGAVKIKSANGDVDVEAGFSSGQGKVSLFAPNSQHVVSDEGISSVSSQNVTSVSAGEIVNAVQPDFNLDNANALSTVLASANINISKISGTDISINSALGDILQKTAQRGHSYNKLGDQIDLLTQNINVLTVQTGSLYSAVESAIGALSGSISLNFEFDIGCAMQQLYDLLPQELLDAYATFQDLKTELASLGYAVENLADLVESLSDPSILSALGLPSLNISASFGSSSCTTVMDRFTGQVSYDVPQLSVPEKLRPLIKNIYDSGSQLGSAPPLTTIDWNKNYV